MRLFCFRCLLALGSCLLLLAPGFCQPALIAKLYCPRFLPVSEKVLCRVKAMYEEKPFSVVQTKVTFLKNLKATPKKGKSPDEFFVQGESIGPAEIRLEVTVAPEGLVGFGASFLVVGKEQSGFVPFLGNFHSHTKYSHDGQMEPIDLLIDARIYGLDFNAVTDHGNVTGALEGEKQVKAYGLNVLVIPGEEISVSGGGHILAINIRKTIDQGKVTPATVAKVIRSLGGYAFAAHPYSEKPKVKDEVLEGYFRGGLFTGFEIFNAASTFPENKKALDKFFELRRKGYKISGIGGADAHYPGTIGLLRVMVFSKKLTILSILDAVKEGRVVVFRGERANRKYYGEEKWKALAQFIDGDISNEHDSLCFQEARLFQHARRTKTQVSQKNKNEFRKHLLDFYLKYFDYAY